MLSTGAVWLAGATAAQAQSQSPAPPALRPLQSPGIVPPVPVNPYGVTLRPDQVELLRRTLDTAHTHGFELEAFAPEAAIALMGSRDATARQTGQAQLVALTLGFAQAVRAGRLPDSEFDPEWGLRPAAYDPAPEFVQAITEDRLGPWIDSLPPPYTGYQTLRRGLTTYRAIAERGGWTALPVGPELKLGDTGARVEALRTRLAAEDPAVSLQGPAVLDEALQLAVKRAQKRFGLLPDAVLGPRTLAALDTPVSLRIDQILANMERWRWLPQTLPADRIQVNIAAAVLSLFQADTPTLTMRAVTGRPGDETPMLQSRIHSVVLNPPWNVPSSIAAKELWPKEKASPGYLARNDFIIINTPDGGSRLQQKAGPKAALGLVKFDFANPYGVYLHDTPSRAKFASFSRLASHGCVRLEKPGELAHAVFAGDPVWTPEVIDQTIAAGKTVRASLKVPIAVFLLYWTAYVTPDGQVNFRDDPYGWDRVLVQRIAAGASGSA